MEPKTVSLTVEELDYLIYAVRANIRADENLIAGLKSDSPAWHKEVSDLKALYNKLNALHDCPYPPYK